MKINEDTAKGIEHIFKAKEAFRKDRANLPFEEKIRILVQLQELAKNVSEINKKEGSNLPVWQL